MTYPVSLNLCTVIVLMPFPLVAGDKTYTFLRNFYPGHSYIQCATAHCNKLQTRAVTKTGCALLVYMYEIGKYQYYYQ